MKALVFHGPWDLRLQDAPKPEAGPGQVLLRTAATGICGSDIHGYAGRTGRRQPGQIMGHETAAWIEAVGEGVDRAVYRPGDLVTVNPVIPCGHCRRCTDGASYMCADRAVIGVTPALSSAFAEYMSVPAGNVVPLGASMTPQLGALVEPLAVGYHAALRGRCSVGELALVIGGGPIGQACAIAARRLGADVVVTEPSEGRRRLVAELGFEAVFDPRDAERLAEHLGEGADLVIDAVGSTDTLRAACESSSAQARIVLVGMHSPALDLPAYQISTAERELIGSFSYSAAEFEATARWLAEHTELSRLVEAEVGWDGAPDAFAALAEGTAAASKILVVPGRSQA